MTSHPIYVPVSDPTEINEIFDTISYAKVKYIMYDGIQHMVICSLFFIIFECLYSLSSHESEDHHAPLSLSLSLSHGYIHYNLHKSILHITKHVSSSCIKGASVLRMIRFVIGEDTFRRGLHVSTTLSTLIIAVT